MGMYNTLLFEGTCPRCGFSGEMKAEFKLGYLDLIEYKMGDTLEWFGGKKSHQPENGDCVGEGYAVCPSCDKDFWLKITVRHDAIASVKVDQVTKGYIE